MCFYSGCDDLLMMSPNPDDTAILNINVADLFVLSGQLAKVRLQIYCKMLI